MVIFGLISIIGLGYYYFYINDSFFDELTYDQSDRTMIINRLLEKKVMINERILLQLKAQGLKEPVNDLRKDLYQKRELISVKGVLGGVMEYTGEFLILPNEKVRVGFSDGHIDGRMSLKYQIKNGKIKWQVIEVE